MRIDACPAFPAFPALPASLRVLGALLAGLTVGPSVLAEVTKCQGGGRTSYVQDGHCPPGQQAVPLQLPALSQADRHPVAPPRDVPQRQIRPQPPSPPVPAGSGERRQERRAAACGMWARQLEALDAQARQPLPAAAQDSLRARRARLRERQAEAGC